MQTTFKVIKTKTVRKPAVYSVTDECSCGHVKKFKMTAEQYDDGMIVVCKSCGDSCGYGDRTGF